MVLKILFKRFEQNINLENGKRIFPSPPCLGLGPFLHPPPWPASPPPPFFPAWPTSRPSASTAERPASARLPFAAAADRPTPRSRVTARWGPTVSTVSYLESEPDTIRVQPNRSTLALYIPPRPSQCSRLNPSISRRVKTHQIHRRDPRRDQSITAARSKPREELAELRLHRAKSPEPSFHALLPCASR